MKSLAPNTLLQNRYLVVHLIGKGGMGDVYLAVDQRLGSAVALKRTFFADDEMLGGAFEREARTLARLRHPVLPKVSDHFTEGGEQYLVMEHISGEDLSKRLEAAQKPFPFSWVLFWADQLLDALSYLHTHEPPIIHRDIKPQNLKLTDENHIILLDFGLSKNTVGETRTSLSSGTGGSTGSVVGYTPHYAPMEQIRGTGTNPRSDLYSLSATIYQLLTNVIPADALSRADSLLNALPDPIKPIYEINPEVSKTVSDVILKGMEVSQERRFGSAREMQKILRDAYAQMNSAMSAQTMAFNLKEVQTEAAPPVSNGDQKTEVLNVPVSENNSAASNAAPPANITGGFAEKTADNVSGSLADARTIAEEPNFDATLRMDAPPVLSQTKSDSGNLQAKQSDVKTEVFLANDIASAIPPTPSFVAGNKEPEREEKFNATENFALTTDFSQAGLGNEASSTAGASNFYTNPQVGNEAGFEDFSATQNFSGADGFAENDAAHKFDSQPETAPVKPVPPVKKGSGGKILAIIAGLGALLLVGLGLAGGGWWYYKNRMTVAATPTPTPMPTVTFTPTAAPTPDITPDTNINSSTNSSGNSGGLSNSENSNSETKTGTVDKTKTPTPTPGGESTPKPTVTPRPTVAKPPPTPKPAKTAVTQTNRTIIDQ